MNLIHILIIIIISKHLLIYLKIIKYKKQEVTAFHIRKTGTLVF